jgi:hypothetical protein
MLSSTRLDLSDWTGPLLSPVFYPGQRSPGNPSVPAPVTAQTTYYAIQPFPPLSDNGSADAVAATNVGSRGQSISLSNFPRAASASAHGRCRSDGAGRRTRESGAPEAAGTMACRYGDSAGPLSLSGGAPHAVNLAIMWSHLQAPHCRLSLVAWAGRAAKRRRSPWRSSG